MQQVPVAQSSTPLDFVKDHWVPITAALVIIVCLIVLYIWFTYKPLIKTSEMAGQQQILSKGTSPPQQPTGTEQHAPPPPQNTPPPMTAEQQQEAEELTRQAEIKELQTRLQFVTNDRNAFAERIAARKAAASQAGSSGFAKQQEVVEDLLIVGHKLASDVLPE